MNNRDWPSCLAAAMFEAPGEQFLLERLRKIEALPPSERPYDAACFLEAYRLQEEVTAALPLQVAMKPF